VRCWKPFIFGLILRSHSVRFGLNYAPVTLQPSLNQYMASSV
jgi:hypothetical protein